MSRAVRDGGRANRVAAAAGYHEPSLVFLAGTPTRLTDGAAAADFLHLAAFAALRSWRRGTSAVSCATRRGHRIALCAAGPRVEGDNIAIGRRVSIAAYRAEARHECGGDGTRAPPSRSAPVRGRTPELARLWRARLPPAADAGLARRTRRIASARRGDPIFDRRP